MLSLLLACALPQGTDAVDPGTADTAAPFNLDVSDDVADTVMVPVGWPVATPLPGTGDTLDCGAAWVGEELALPMAVDTLPDTFYCDDRLYGTRLDVMDLDGDGAVDLVQMLPCDADVVRVWTGASNWEASVDLTLPAELPIEDGRIMLDWRWANIDGECGLDLVARGEDVIHIYAQTASGFDAPYDYETWNNFMPGGYAGASCSSGKTSRSSEGYWLDMDGDGDEDLVVESDSCDIFGTTGWIPSKHNRLTGKNQAVHYGAGVYSRPVQVNPSPAMEVAGWDYQNLQLVITELRGSEYVETMRLDLPNSGWNDTGDELWPWTVVNPDTGETLRVGIFDVDGDGWGDVVVDGPETDTWYRGTQLGFDAPLQLELREQTDCGTRVSRVDTRAGYLRIHDTCGNAADGLGDTFARVDVIQP